MNNVPDMSGLIKGILAVIGIAMATGQYPRLESWSRSQAIEALEWKQGLPHFFKAQVHSSHSKHPLAAQVSSKEHEPRFAILRSDTKPL